VPARQSKPLSQQLNPRPPKLPDPNIRSLTRNARQPTTTGMGRVQANCAIDGAELSTRLPTNVFVKIFQEDQIGREDVDQRSRPCLPGFAGWFGHRVGILGPGLTP
jgi:hypothetical protein